MWKPSNRAEQLICGLKGVVCFSEIYQVTGPVERFAGQIASHGYVVGGSGYRDPSYRRVEKYD